MFTKNNIILFVIIILFIGAIVIVLLLGARQLEIKIYEYRHCILGLAGEFVC